MMKQELPKYIQNMFIAAGYETLQTIAEMDVNLGSDLNDIDKMFMFSKPKQESQYVFLTNLMVNVLR